jgi:hypothetical protein
MIKVVDAFETEIILVFLDYDRGDCHYHTIHSNTGDVFN